jgi:choline kinase
MRAIILAAGMSSRMQATANQRPKCLLPLHGQPLIRHQLAQLSSCSITDLLVVIGYRGEAIRSAVDGVTFAEYDGYADHNNLWTLWSCRSFLTAECLVLFADVLVTPARLAALASSEEDYAILADTSSRRPGTMRIRRDGDALIDIGSHIPVEACDGNFVGIAKFSARGAARLAMELNQIVAEPGHEEEYYTTALPRLGRAGHRIAIVAMLGDEWLELDTPEDYAIAAARDFYLVDHHLKGPPSHVRNRRPSSS